MKKPARHFLVAKSKRKYAFVCASILVVGALMMGSFTSIPLAHHLFHGGNFGLITHIHIQDDLFSSGAQAIEIKEVHKSSTSAKEDNQSKLLISTHEVHFDQKNSTHDGLLHDGEPISSIEDGSSFKENAQEMKAGCTKSAALLKVFMYDLSPEFHFGMIEPMNVKQGNTWPTNFTNIVSYPGGLYQQHSPEYWLTLDLLNNLEEEQEGGHNSLDSFSPKSEKGHASRRTSKLKRRNNSTIFHSRVDEGSNYNYNLMYHNKNILNRRVENEYGNGFSNPKVIIDSPRRPCGAIRVKDGRDADVYFVPFFASLSYNKYTRLGMGEKDRELQKKVVDFVVKQEAWKRSKGRDHVIVMHHPNSLHMARTLLQGATFVVADFGRFSAKVAHFGKDVVAPYQHIIPSFNEDHSSFQSRPTLLFFQGAISRKEGGIIRKKLYSLIKNEKGVVFKDGISGVEGIKSATKGMRSSKFCLHLARDTPSSNRLFDAIASHCVPVIISNDVELPYENVLDYSQFCLFVNSSHALKKGFLIALLRSIGRDEWTRMWKRLRKVRMHFEYRFPSQVDDAVQMVWKSIAYKVPTIKQGLHKSDRYSRSNIFKKVISL